MRNRAFRSIALQESAAPVSRGRTRSVRWHVLLEKAGKLYNMLTNKTGARSPPSSRESVHEKSVIGVAAGCQCDACDGAGEDLRTEDIALGAGVASAAEGAGGMGCRGREGFRRHRQVQGLPGPAAWQGVRPLR